MLAAATAACAQTTPPAPISARAPEEAVLLSPFEVSTDRDVGFAASSSLAGGRLALDLRDTPVAYSVVTREFIDALQITDLQGAAEWTTGSTAIVDNGEYNFGGVPVQYTTRGSIGGRQQRNFFPQFNNGDSYNLERYDFGRGPNSILFGNGTLGGVSSATTKRARTDRAARSVGFSVASWRNYRATVDLNQPITPYFALRTAAVWGDGDGWRMKEFDRRKALFLTSTVKPTKTTEIRLEGEYGTNARQVGHAALFDLFSGWDGRTTFDTPQGARTLPGNAAAIGINRQNANYYIYIPSSGVDAVMNEQNAGITRGGGSSATTPIAGFTSGSAAAFGSSGAPILYGLNLPSHRFDTAIANSAFRVPSEEFTTSPDVASIAQRFKDLQLTFTQRLGRLFFEIAGDINRADALIDGEPDRQTTNTLIDINRVLPNGATNPNFLQPYGDARLTRRYRTNDYENLRAAVAYSTDSRWGRFAFNLLGGINSGENTTNDRWLSMALGNDHRQWGFVSTRQVQNVRVRRHWNQTSRPIPDLSLHPVLFIDPVAGTSQQIQPIWAVDTTRRDQQGVNHETYRYLLASVNAKFLKERLVVLGGVRYDSYKFRSDLQIDPGDYPLDWTGLYRILRPGPPSDYNALTYVPKDAAGRPAGPAVPADIRPRDATTGDRDPRYANDRFKDDYNSPASTGGKVTRSFGAVAHIASWLSPSVNYSETFNPPGFIVRIDGRKFDPSVATGWDFGLRSELLGSSLNLNLTYYRTKQINSPITADGPKFFNTLYDANVVGDQSAAGRNIRGAGTLPVQYQDMRTTTGDGVEFEIVYNPTKALRFTSNIARPNLYESNLNPDVKAYIDKNGDLFRQIATDAGAVIGANNVASVNSAIPVNNRSPDVDAAVQAYNDLYAFRANIPTRKRRYADQVIVNTYADYTFQEGFLKRLRVGAGVQYMGRQIVGSRGADTIVDPANSTRAIDDPSVDEYTPVFTPKANWRVTGTMGYSWKLQRGSEVLVNLVVNNLLNDRGAIYSAGDLFSTTSAMRPKGGDYNSPARETIASKYALKKPISFTLSTTLKF